MANIPPSAPPKVNTAKQTSTLTAIKGLMSELNAQQQQLVSTGVVEVADIYEIAFVPATLAQSTIVQSFDMRKDWSTTAMQDGESAAAQADPETQTANAKTRTWSINAGTQIVQVIDMIMRNSSYISDQARVFIDEESQDPVPQKPLGNMAWYKISVFATPLKVDNKRNDYAYRMKFVVTPYGINSMQSEYFPSGNFRGVHKNYDYWFTGLNTQVLDFEQEFNYAYHINLSQPELAPELKRLVDTREVTPQVYTGTNEESSQGAAGRAFEIGASAASYLYSPKDQGTVKMRIIGDPAWMQQGEAAFGVTSETFTEFSPFNRDGTINFDSYQILFRINWNRASDYDLATGLMNNSTILKSGPPRESATYIAKEVISTFRAGKFEQALEGKLLLLPASAKDQMVSDQARPGTKSTAPADQQFDAAMKRAPEVPDNFGGEGIDDQAVLDSYEAQLSESEAITRAQAEDAPAFNNGEINYNDVDFVPPAAAVDNGVATVDSGNFVAPPVLPSIGQSLTPVTDKFNTMAGRILPAQLMRKDSTPG